MKTLFEVLQDAILFGYIIEFRQEVNQLYIKVGHKKTITSDELVTKESALPLSDHFYERKVIHCIEWMINEIDKDINK